MYAHMSGHICSSMPPMMVYRTTMVAWRCTKRLNGASTVMWCVYILTYTEACGIELLMATPAKKKALLASGTLNPHPEDVRSELFKMDFFDPWDRAQVKYEMLRAHSVDGDPVAEACRQFGFSRESFYQIQDRKST